MYFREANVRQTVRNVMADTLKSMDFQKHARNGFSRTIFFTLGGIFLRNENICKGDIRMSSRTV
jgi:hypothetical protein